MKRNLNKIFENSVSCYDDYCDGFVSCKKSDNYFLTFLLSVGVVDRGLRHDGSDLLDKINAFDQAEVEDTFLGQINMITVSSFCGPQGMIWGYDLIKPELLRKKHPLVGMKYEDKDEKVKVYDIEPLLFAGKQLFGTVKKKHFPLKPGSHVPCAGKNTYAIGPKRIYAAVAMGIPEDRDKNACLLMEDIGYIPLIDPEDMKRRELYKADILENMVKSVLVVGENQRVKYKEIFIGMKDVYVKEGQVGCALVAAPYFCLAKKAIVKNTSDMLNISLVEWKKGVKDNFLYHSND